LAATCCAQIRAGGWRTDDRATQGASLNELLSDQSVR